MTQETRRQAENGTGAGRTSGNRRARSWIMALALVGVGAVGGSLVTMVTDAGAHGGWRHGRGMYGHGPETAAQAIERVQHVSARVLGAVDATDDQRERIDAIVAAAVTDLFALHTEHRDHRSDWIAELTRPAVDRNALERVRTAELALAELASTRALDATVAIAQVLDADQRQRLVGKFADRWH
jgi:Spy/CpxP family protein refolding chaperone